MSDDKSTVTITDASFVDDVLTSEKPVLVDFWATWCGPCKMVAPVLEEIAAEHKDKLTIAKLDIDANPQAARDFKVMSIPTLIDPPVTRVPRRSRERRVAGPQMPSGESPISRWNEDRPSCVRGPKKPSTRSL